MLGLPDMLLRNNTTNSNDKVPKERVMRNASFPERFTGSEIRHVEANDVVVELVLKDTLIISSSYVNFRISGFDFLDNADEFGKLPW